MKKHASAARPTPLRYHYPMTEAVAPEHAKRMGKPRTKKIIINTPGTVESISQGVKVTRRDAAIVQKVLTELGFLKNP